MVNVADEELSPKMLPPLLEVAEGAAGANKAEVDDAVADPKLNTGAGTDEENELLAAEVIAGAVVVEGKEAVVAEDRTGDELLLIILFVLGPED